MTISYSFLPEPIWYFADLSGLPLGSGLMFTYSSLNPTVPKPVFMDPQGANAWPNPVNIGLNGTSGPFYGKFDSSNPADLYDIVVRDTHGNLIWQVNNFQGGGSGGGGGTTVQQIDNLVVNNVFWRNIGTVAGTPSLPTFLKLAPSVHEGLAEGLNTGGWTGADTVFVKNSTANSDTISFPAFGAGSTLLSPEITPVVYLNYNCSTGLPGESYKYIQIPITNYPNLSGQQVTVSMWGRCTSGANGIALFWRTFYGDSGGSPDLPTAIASINLTAVWAKYTFVVTTPNAAAGVPGACGNGALFLNINLPLNLATNIELTKPSIYLGLFSPPTTFQNMDEISAVVDTPRTGDIRISANSFAPYGWVVMQDGTIGNAASGATARANIDTFALYSLLYVNVSNTYAPVSGGRSGVGIASAIIDFNLGKTLQLTQAAGRVLGGTGTGSYPGASTRALGENLGAEAYGLVSSDLPQHTHDSPSGASYLVQVAGGDWGGGATGGHSTITGGVTGFGVQTDVSLMQPTTFMNIFIHL